jgi:hypothetical protein
MNLIFAIGIVFISCSKNISNIKDHNAGPDSLTFSYIADDSSIFPNPERG